jgi:hypothetical protein
LIFLVSLNINTNLCWKQKLTSQSKCKRNCVILYFFILICLFTLEYGSENKQILLQSIKVSLKEVLKSLSKCLEKEPEPYEQIKKLKLGVNSWKFTPESRILLLNIVSIDDEIISVESEIAKETVEIDEIKNVYNNENDENINIETVGFKNDKNTSKKDQCVKVHFNAKSDVMIQTNYPLLNINKMPLDAIALSMGKNY